MWKRVTFFTVALLVSVTVTAGSLTNGDLPADSNWYVHVNVELMRTTTLGQRMMDETIGEAFQDIESEIGVQFTDQIEGITVFGGQLPPNEGAVVTHGNFRDDTREELIDAMSKAGTFVEGQHAGMTFYGIDDLDGKVGEPGDGKFLYVAFGDDQTMFSSSQVAVERFLEAGAYLANLDSDPATLLVIEADRAMLQGGVNTKGGHHGDWDSSILSNVQRVTAILVDDNGAASFHADVTANSPEVAESVRNIVEGLVALKALESSDEPALGELLRATKIETNGADITIDIYIEPRLLTDLMEL